MVMHHSNKSSHQQSPFASRLLEAVLLHHDCLTPNAYYLLTIDSPIDSVATSALILWHPCQKSPRLRDN